MPKLMPQAVIGAAGVLVAIAGIYFPVANARDLWPFEADQVIIAPPDLPQMTLEIEPTGTIFLGETATIKVDVSDARGGPIEGANVRIEIESGAFVGSGAYQVTGQTDQFGDFSDVWSCLVGACATGDNRFVVHADKDGFQPAVQDSKIVASLSPGQPTVPRPTLIPIRFRFFPLRP